MTLVTHHVKVLDVETDGTKFYGIEVVPHFKAFASGGIVYLDQAEFDAFRRWQDGEGNIQELLPSLSDNDREMLLSGMTPQEWTRHCGRPDPHERR
jgi:hypothetical protein